MFLLNTKAAYKMERIKRENIEIFN